MDNTTFSPEISPFAPFRIELIRLILLAYPIFQTVYSINSASDAPFGDFNTDLVIVGKYSRESESAASLYVETPLGYTRPIF